MFAAALSLAATCRWQFLAALSVVVAVLILYDLFSKRMGIGKQLLVAALMTSIYPLAFAQAGGATGGRAGTLAIFPVWMFLTSFGYEGLKDVRDITGDRSVSDIPTWIQRHPVLGRRISLAAVLVGPYFAGCGWVYLAVASVVMLVAMVTVLVPAPWTLTMIYVECVLVGIAATADLIVRGV